LLRIDSVNSSSAWEHDTAARLGGVDMYTAATRVDWGMLICQVRVCIQDSNFIPIVLLIYRAVTLLRLVCHTNSRPQSRHGHGLPTARPLLLSLKGRSRGDSFWDRDQLYWFTHRRCSYKQIRSVIASWVPFICFKFGVFKKSSFERIQTTQVPLGVYLANLTVMVLIWRLWLIYGDRSMYRVATTRRHL